MSAPSTNLKMEHYKGLDLLRFVAASCVILHHCSQALADKGHNISANSNHIYTGSFFLDLFFVISGFLIGIILFKEMDAGQFSFKKFITRRILRIWPLFFFIIIVKVIVLPMAKGINTAEIIYNAQFASTFTTNFQLIFGESYDSTYKILWSVCVEEHLYLIFPLLAILFKKLRLAMVVCMIGFGLLSFYFAGDIFTSSTGFNVGYFFTTSYLYYFGLGSLLAVLFHHHPDLIKKLTDSLTHWAVQTIILLVGLAFVFNQVTTTPYSLTALLFLNGFLATYMVFLAATGKLVFDKLGAKTTRFLGNISYAMYLIHPFFVWGHCFNFIIGTKQNLMMSDYTFKFPLYSLIVTMVYATILHFLIERPFLKMKKKYAIVQNE